MSLYLRSTAYQHIVLLCRLIHCHAPKKAPFEYVWIINSMQLQWLWEQSIRKLAGCVSIQHLFLSHLR